MLKIIYGKRGSGNTKRMLEIANSDVATKKGDLVYIDKDNHCMLNLHHDIRYMNALEYVEKTQDYFLGFICGVIASDYDIEKIYIDGVSGVFKGNELENFVKETSQIAIKNEVQIIMAISGDKAEVPEHIKEYLIKK